MFKQSRKHTLYRGKDCKIKFCESLREHAQNIINFEKKKMLPLTTEELKSHPDARVCYICRKRIFKILLMTIVMLQVNIEVTYIVFVI